ncbi:MAG: thiamine-phosphate kinase [Spirochaetia bacterium]|jgi:thiamine-monophosphate kinase
MKIGQIGEFGLIERIRAALPGPGPNVIVGIGDDVAVLKAASATESVWLATCDVQVEGAHFLRHAILPRSLGRKALAINLSDIASAGGIPRYALVSLGLPADLEVAFIDELYAGLREQGGEFGVQIVGGNISRSHLGIFIDVFLLGETIRENVVLRSGAAVGDLIMVTGTVGDAAAGVALLLDPELVDATDAAYAEIARSRRDSPAPRVREGALIGSLRQASAMIDVSDGIAGDLRHICEKSGVSVRLHADTLPVSAANRALSRAARGDEWHFALHGGEDYELLFTAPPGRAGKLAQRITSETGTPVSVIGEIISGGGQPELILPDGSSRALEESGWDHFK